MRVIERHEVIVLSLGAGVQSSALLLICDREPARVGAALGIEDFRCDLAVFADTQDEPQSVYDWLPKLESVVKTVPIIKTTRGSIMEDNLHGENFGRPPWFITTPVADFRDAAGNDVTLGDPQTTKGMLRRQCTERYKVRAITAAVRAHLGIRPGQRWNRHVTRLLGISTDEAGRMKPSHEKWATNVYPLIELGMSRQDCIAYVEATGLGTPPRSACIHCPFHSDAEWIRLRDHEPADWARAVEFDHALRSGCLARTDKPLVGTPYLHAQRVPLDQVKFKDDGVESGGENECGGNCFV